MPCQHAVNDLKQFREVSLTVAGMNYASLFYSINLQNTFRVQMKQFFRQRPHSANKLNVVNYNTTALKCSQKRENKGCAPQRQFLRTAQVHAKGDTNERPPRVQALSPSKLTFS